jgi:hypothetical protein
LGFDLLNRTGTRFAIRSPVAVEPDATSPPIEHRNGTERVSSSHRNARVVGRQKQGVAPDRAKLQRKQRPLFHRLMCDGFDLAVQTEHAITNLHLSDRNEAAFGPYRLMLFQTPKAVVQVFIG